MPEMLAKFKSNDRYQKQSETKSIQSKFNPKQTEQIQTPIIFKTNNQTLTDKFKLGQPNKQIGSNDLQQRQSNSGNQLQKPDKRRSKFSKTNSNDRTNSKRPD